MATIIRNLIISSLDQLYNLLKNNEELIVKSDKFSNFLEFMKNYKNGCMCFEDMFFNLSIGEYNKISENQELIELIKDHFKCDSVKIILN